MKNFLIKIYLRTIGRFFILAHYFSIDLRASRVQKLDQPYRLISIKETDLQRYDLIFKERNADYPSFVREMVNNPKVIGLGIVDTNLNQIVYSCWIRLDGMYDKALQREIILKEDECYFFDANCATSFRGKGLHTYMIQARINYSFRLGKKRAFITIYGFNAPALSVGKAFNYKRVRSVFRYRQGSIKTFGQLLIRRFCGVKK